MLSGRNQSIGCAVVWVSIARDSESDHPFNPAGNSTGFVHVTNLTLPIGGEIKWQLFFNHSTVFTDGCD